nr:MAG TPA: hypothetical protein [Caudoviricetes sp.]
MDSIWEQIRLSATLNRADSQSARRGCNTSTSSETTHPLSYHYLNMIAYIV